MHVWTFHFNEGQVQSRVTDEAENDRIRACVSLGDGWISLPGEANMDVQVNLSAVKAITHHLFTEAELKAAEEAQKVKEAGQQDAQVA